MNISLSELMIVLINIVLIIGIPVAIILIVIQLFRRTRDLEARVTKLEGHQDTNAK